MTDTGTMRLSEALRLGSMATKQIYFSYYECGPGGQIVGTCAVGAIRLALGRLEDSIPALRASIYTGCPVCSTPFIGTIMANVLIHLNDIHRLTRAQIADWLEQWEEGHTERAEERPTVLAQSLAKR